MRLMSSKNIKDHYGEFVNTARQQRVIHTSHDRTVLVSLAFEKFARVYILVYILKTTQFKLLQTLDLSASFNKIMADREGFEPSIRY